MRKTIPFLTIMLLAAMSVSAQKKGVQTDVGTLTYDFATKSFTNITTIPRYNEPYRIVVTNVDRLAYNVVIVADDIEFGSEEPELWKKYFKDALPLVNNKFAAPASAMSVLNSNPNEYTSPPLYPKGSMLGVGIRIYPNDSSLARLGSSEIPLTDDSLGIELRVRNKWNFSFSSGPFAVFSNRHSPSSYHWQRLQDDNGLVTDSANYRLVESGGGLPPIGLAAFANIGTMLTDGFGLGFSLGVGVAIEDDPKPVYMLGGTIMAGGKRQFCFSIGLSLMQVDELRKDLYPDNALYMSTQDLEYKQVLTPGGFASVTYTLYTLDRRRTGKSRSAR